MNKETSLFWSDEIEAEYNSLMHKIGYHDHLYHAKDQPVISDGEYDSLKQSLNKIISEYPGIASKTAISKVGAAPAEGFNKVRHAVPMLSLSNAFEDQDVHDFIDRVRKFLSLPETEIIEFVAEPKIDGLSCSLRYEDGVLVMAATQGEPPGFSHSIRPEWNDFNLRDLALNIVSSLFMAHVRATSMATIQETNCHPFRYKNWLFLHNGQIEELQKFRKELIVAVSEEYFENILGSTDSELMFHLALTFGLEKDVPLAIARMTGLVEKVAKKHGVAESVWMTLRISDGKTLWGFRYGSDGDGPSLYYSTDVEELNRVNPLVKGRYESYARCLVSEPIGKFQELWKEDPQSSTVVIRDGNVDIKPFKRMNP